MRSTDRTRHLYGKGNSTSKSSRRVFNLREEQASPKDRVVGGSVEIFAAA